MLFRELVGQESAKNHLVRSARAGRVSHAQLFLGAEGSGALPLALAYAQYLNCEQPLEEDSCGECPSCRKYNKLIHPDLHFSYPFFSSSASDHAGLFLESWRKAFLDNPYLNLDIWRNYLEAGNKQANINIAECHHIIRKLSLKSFEGRYKVLIMWLPEFLDKSGNALLKLIEEPPERTLFLLVAENQDRLLTTLLSRTQLVKVNTPDLESVAAYLIRRNDVDEEKARQLAYLSEGNVNIALQLLQEGGSNYFDLLVRWLRLSFSHRILELMDLIDDELAKLGRENQKSFLHYALKVMREVVLFKEGASSLIHVPDAEMAFVKNFSPLYSVQKLAYCAQLFEKASYFIERNANPKILFLDVSLQLVTLFKRS